MAGRCPYHHGVESYEHYTLGPVCLRIRCDVVQEKAGRDKKPHLEGVKQKREGFTMDPGN